jgi:hypothetical protein
MPVQGGTDENNFQYELLGEGRIHKIVMEAGDLSIDDCSYENVPDGGDVVYALTRACARAQGIIP